MQNSVAYSENDKNNAICKKSLDFIPNGNFSSLVYEKCQNMTFIRIKGITNFWGDNAADMTADLMSDILGSLVRHGVPFSFVITGDGKGISVLIGTMRPLMDGLVTSIEAIYPGAHIVTADGNPLEKAVCEHGGLFTGIPTDKLTSDAQTLQIENICRGMIGLRFTYLIVATGISGNAVSFAHERILEEMGSAFQMISQTVSGGMQGNITAQKQDFISKNYFDNLELLEKTIKSGTAKGMWRVNGYYASDTVQDARRLGNIIKASFAGDKSAPEPFRLIEYNRINDVIPEALMMVEPDPFQDIHPLGHWFKDGIAQEISLYVYKYQTILNSNLLATLCRLPTKEFPGYYIDQYVEFDVSNRIETRKCPLTVGEISQVGQSSKPSGENKYLIDRNDLTRHALVIGVTGGGKTNTSKSLLSSLWTPPSTEKKIPFLVIESAKREYWELRNIKGFEDLLVFTMGAESEASSVRYRINPFEVVSGISLQTHIDYLLSTFKAAFEMQPPMPYVLERALFEVYSDRGWNITENINNFGLTEYPTLTDLYRKVEIIADGMGYDREVRSNVKAALQARINSLMIGGKGAMLNTPRSIPIDKLLSRPVVLELEDIGDDETKSFVIGILLVQLYEYRKSLPNQGGRELSHVLVVEEAHRLLKNVSAGESNSTVAKSVEFFCNMLAEIRAFGQGIFIADQIPTKLAPDTIKNTNLKIAHRTVAAEDREAIGKAMNMTDSQTEYLSSLPRGYAAVYSEGDNRPKCVKFPLVEPFYDKSRSQVIQEVRRTVAELIGEYDKTINLHAACAYCEEKCRHFNKLSAFLDSEINCEKVLEKWAAKGYSPSILQAFLDSGLMKELDSINEFSSRCIIGIILSNATDLNDSHRQEIIANYLKFQNRTQQL